jgi:hypothetical protein
VQVPVFGNQMLQQRSAGLHVDDLQAPTDAQHGQIALQSLREECAFRTVARIVGLIRFRASIFAIQCRIQIGAADQHQSRHAPKGCRVVRQHELRLDPGIAQGLLIRLVFFEIPING